MEDVTGQPRPERDVDAALKFVEREMIYNPLAKASDGTPALIHYMVIRDVLRDYLVRLRGTP